MRRFLPVMCRRWHRYCSVLRQRWPVSAAIQTSTSRHFEGLTWRHTLPGSFWGKISKGWSSLVPYVNVWLRVGCVVDAHRFQSFTTFTDMGLLDAMVGPDVWRIDAMKALGIEPTARHLQQLSHLAHDRASRGSRVTTRHPGTSHRTSDSQPASAMSSSTNPSTDSATASRPATAASAGSRGTDAGEGGGSAPNDSRQRVGSRQARSHGSTYSTAASRANGSPLLLQVPTVQPT